MQQQCNKTIGQQTHINDKKLTPEDRLVDWYVYCRQAGFFNIHNRRLIKEAKIVLRGSLAQGLQLDADWCERFLKRHKPIQAAIKLCSAGKNHSSTILEIWFKAIGTFCRERQMLECLRQSQQLLYCCKLQLTDNVKIMLTYSSQGLVTPPVLVQENLDQLDMDTEEDFDMDFELPEGWIKYNCLADDDNDTNMYYLKHVLDKNLKQNNKSYPILLFMDYQNWPLTLKLYELCSKLNIFIINSYAKAFNYTRDMQQQLTSDIQNSSHRNLNSYIEIFQNMLTTHLTRENMKLNFYESGIYPFDIAHADLTLRNQMEKIQAVPVAIQKVEPGIQPTNIFPRSKKDVQNAQLVPIAIQRVQPIVKPATNNVPTINETKRKSDILLDLNEFRDITGGDTVNKLQMSLNSATESKSSEFNALLMIYRKFYDSNNDNDSELQNDNVEVKNEPIMED